MNGMTSVSSSANDPEYVVASAFRPSRPLLAAFMASADLAVHG
jgi:hypothetical protein